MNRSFGTSEAASSPARRPRWAWGVFVGALSLLPLIALGLGQVRLSNDTSSWLPLDDPHGQILRWHQNAFRTDDAILVTWEGSTLNDPRVELLAARLRGEIGEAPFGIDDATAPHDALSSMVDLDVPQDEAIRRLRGTFIGSGFLKVALTEHGRQHRSAAEELLIAAGDSLDLDLQVYPAVIEPEEWLAETAEVSTEEHDRNQTSLTRPFAAIPTHDLQLRWQQIAPHSPVAIELQELIDELTIGGDPIVDASFFADGSPVAVSVSFSDDGLDQLQRSMDALYAVADEVGIPREDLHLGGSTVVSHRLSQESARALWNPDHPLWKFYKRSPVLLSGLVGIVIAFLVLRSAKLAMIVMLVSVYSASAMLAIVAATGTPLNLVLVVMPNLLMVITLSGAIHVANYWCHAVADGYERPVAHAVSTAWKPCLLASLTTAIGLMSLLASQLSPVRDFGWFSAWGCLLSLMMVLGVLPAVLALLPPTGAAVLAASTGRWEAFGRWVYRYHLRVAMGSLVLLAIGGWGLQWFHTETKGIRYFPEESRIVQDYRYLEESLSGIVNLDVDIHFKGNRDAENGESGGSPDFDRRNVFDRMQLVQRVEDVLAEHAAITGTLSVVDFQVIPEPPGPEASSRTRMLYARRAQRTENELFHDPREGAGQFAHLVETPLSVLLDDRRLDWETGDEVWRIRAQSSVMSEMNYAALLAEVEDRIAETLASEDGVDYAVTGLVPLMLRTQQEVLDSLIDSFGLAFLLIAIVMSILLRSLLAGLITMFPNFLPVIVVFGMISWVGISVDMGTMITASVALGIAVDGTLHLLTWFQEGIRQGLDRRTAVSRALGHCGPAMWQTSVSISLGLLMLWGADLLLISRFGWLMAALIMLALLADVVLSPALLSGVLGRLLEVSNRVRIEPPPPTLTISSADSRLETGEPSTGQAGERSRSGEEFASPRE